MIPQPLDADAGRSIQLHRIGSFGFGRLLEFHQAVDGGGGIDKGRDLTGQVHDRALDLAHQLQESGHDAESDGPFGYSVHAPEKCGDITERECGADHRPGDDIETGALHDLPVFPALQPVQAVLHPAFVLHGLDDHPVLETLLQMALHLTLGFPDTPGHFAQTAEEQLAERNEQRRHHDQKEGETPFHRTQENDGRHQLDEGREDLRDVGADNPGHRTYIRLQPVHGVAGMPAFLPQPLGLQETGIESFPDNENHLGPREVFQSHVEGRDGQPEDDHRDDDACIKRQASRLHTGGDVHQVLAQPDEIQVQSHIQGAQQDIHQDGAPRPHRMRPEPAQVIQDRFHSPSESLWSP